MNKLGANPSHCLRNVWNVRMYITSNNTRSPPPSRLSSGFNASVLYRESLSKLAKPLSIHKFTPSRARAGERNSARNGYLFKPRAELRASRVASAGAGRWMGRLLLRAVNIYVNAYVSSKFYSRELRLISSSHNNDHRLSIVISCFECTASICTYIHTYVCM
jgi:hypothetical protein